VDEASDEQGAESSRRIIVADDHSLFRAALRQMLREWPDLEVVGEASDGREAVEVCHRLRPEVVLMDVQMPVMGGIEATRRIKQQLPSTIVLILTAFASPEYLLEAIKAGASGYALKHANPQQIAGAIRKVIEGELPFDQEVAMQLLVRLVEEKQQKKEAPSREASEEERARPPLLLREPLTPREEEVLRLLVEGQINQQIAQSLFVSPSTVKHHVRTSCPSLVP
jgi:DNA-binding NarL/FixJ family response regulator